MAREIVILGGGGHAKVLMDCAATTGLFRIKGIVDPKIKAGSLVAGIEVLGGDELLEDALKGVCLALGLGSVKASEARKNIYEKYRGMGFEFPAIVHSEAYVSKAAETAGGVQVMAGAIIQPGASIGENTIINTAAVVEHDCEIGAHCHISPGAVLGGGVRVGECSHIGLGARALQGVRIGKGVTVGAGAVVTSDVEDGKTVMGMPAK